MDANVVVKVVTGDAYCTVNVVGQGADHNVASFDSALPELLNWGLRDVIVNCQHLTAITLPWIRSLLTLTRKLSDEGKQMRLIYVNREVDAFLKKSGVDSALRTSPNLKTALAELGIAKAIALDVNLIGPFLTSAISVLETQASTKAKPGKAFRKKPEEQLTGDISGVIALTSDSFHGTMILSFPKATFLKIISKMMGSEVTELTSEIGSGAGELTNIIFGQAKVTLNERGFGIHKSLPQVVAGHEESGVNIEKGSRVVIPFETDSGPFSIEISVAA